LTDRSCALAAEKFAKARRTADGKPRPDIAISSFGYKSSISICRVFGFIRRARSPTAAAIGEAVVNEAGRGRRLRRISL